MRGIPTMHNGIKHRSLLEAKWASFFTRIGWQFEYEPFEGNGYIPDFLVQGDSPFLVEVKPAVNLKELEAHATKVTDGLSGIWSHDVLIVGAGPLTLGSSDCDAPVVGLLGEWDGSQMPFSEPSDNPSGFIFGAGVWSACPECHYPAVVHEYMSYQRRPCSHYDGSMWTLHSSQVEALTAHWKRACNEVQWRGAAAPARAVRRSPVDSLAAAGLTPKQIAAAKQLFT